MGRHYTEFEFNQVPYADVRAEELLGTLTRLQVAVIASGLKDGCPDVNNIRDFFDCGRPRPWAIKALIGGGDTLANLWKLPRESRHGISTEEREDLVHDLAEAALRTFYTESNLSFVETHWGDIQPILRDRRHSDDVETNRRLEMLTHRSSPDLFVADYSSSSSASPPATPSSSRSPFRLLRPNSGRPSAKKQHTRPLSSLPSRYALPPPPPPPIQSREISSSSSSSSSPSPEPVKPSSSSKRSTTPVARSIHRRRSPSPSGSGQLSPTPSRRAESSRRRLSTSAARTSSRPPRSRAGDEGGDELDQRAKTKLAIKKLERLKLDVGQR